MNTSQTQRSEKSVTCGDNPHFALTFRYYAIVPARRQGRRLCIGTTNMEVCCGLRQWGDVHRIYTIAEQDSIEFNLAHLVEDYDIDAKESFDRILKSRWVHALGGAYDCVVRGKMMGGFGPVAYPANWGNSDVIIFLVSHDSVVYQKDLCPDTAAIARAQSRFDPDSMVTRL